MTSPTLTSLNFSKPMPHSKPALTSETSSLKRRSEPILPSWTTDVVAQQARLRSPERVMRPSVTMQPAMVPNFGVLKMSRTCARADATSLNVGSSSPVIAFFISSTTL